MSQTETYIRANASQAARGLLTVPEIAEEPRLSRASIYRAMDERRLAFLQLGRRRRVTREQLDAFIAASVVEAIGGDA